MRKISQLHPVNCESSTMVKLSYIMSCLLLQGEKEKEPQQVNLGKSEHLQHCIIILMKTPYVYCSQSKYILHGEQMRTLEV